MKLGSQIVPPAQDPTDIANQEFVERLGGRGAPDFMVARLDSNQNHSGGGVAVDFETVISRRGLNVDAAGKFSTFKAGRTYFMQMTGRILDVSGGTVEFEWFDVTGSAQIGVRSIHKTSGSATDETYSPVCTTMFAPEQDSEVELRIVSSADTGQIILGNANDFTGVVIYEIAGPAIAGPMEFIETIEGDGGSSVTFNGLNGDEDEIYFLTFSWINSDSPTVRELQFKPNALATNQDAQRTAANDSTVAALDMGTVMLLVQAAEDECQGTCTFHAATGSMRSFVANVSCNDSTGPVTALHVYSGVWTDTSTNVTSLLIDAGAGTIAVGSKFNLYRIRAQNFPENNFPPGHLDGLLMNFNSISTVDIDPGTAKDSTSKRDITVKSTLTANLAASGANGLDTGSEAASTWYALHVIDGLGVAAASLLSLSATAPTLPSGYDVFRRVGWVRNNGSSAIEEFRKREGSTSRSRTFSWLNSLQVLNARTTTVTVDASAFAPPTSRRLFVVYSFSTSFQANGINFYQDTTSNYFQHWHYAEAAGSFNRNSCEIGLTSAQSFHYVEAGSDVVLDVWVQGYTDEL